MANPLRVEVRGLADLQAKLRELPRVAERRVLRNAAAAGARIVRAEARARAPVLKVPRVGREPGRLRANVIVARLRNTPYAVSYGVGVRGSGKRKADDRKNAFYWRFVEFGTSKMAAIPFLRPAFEASKTTALKAIVERLREGIAKEVARLRGVGGRK